MCYKQQRTVSTEMSSADYPKAFSHSQLSLKEENRKWKRRTRRIWTMQALVMNLCQYRVLGIQRCKIAVDIWEFVQGIFLEELKVKITEARMHTSSNLTSKIIPPPNFSSFAGSSAPSYVRFV